MLAGIAVMGGSVLLMRRGFEHVSDALRRKRGRWLLIPMGLIEFCIGTLGMAAFFFIVI